MKLTLVRSKPKAGPRFANDCLLNTQFESEKLAAGHDLHAAPILDSPTEIHSFRDDWNVQEFVWVSGGRYHFMGWDTAA